jgi:hypothetical protein
MRDLMSTPRKTTSPRLSLLGGVYALLAAADNVGDHWVQTNGQARRKDGQGWPGRRACAAHVATLTATEILFLAGGVAATGTRLDPRRVALGLAFNGVTHYWADRRFTLRKLASHTKKTKFIEFGNKDLAPCGTGAYVLDQAFHDGARAITAAIIIGGRS